MTDIPIWKCEVERCETPRAPDKRFCARHIEQWPKVDRTNIEAWMRGDLDPSPAMATEQPALTGPLAKCEFHGCAQERAFGDDLCTPHRALVGALQAPLEECHSEPNRCAYWDNPNEHCPAQAIKGSLFCLTHQLRVEQPAPATSDLTRCEAIFESKSWNQIGRCHDERMPGELLCRFHKGFSLERPSEQLAPAAKLCSVKGCLAQPVPGSDLCEVHERAEVLALAQQPAPTTSPESRPVLVLLAKRFDVGEDALCRLAEREASVGIKRYGVGLHTHNGRDTVRDLHEEALDAVMYAAKAWLERPEALSETALLRALELEKAVAHMGVKP